MLLKREGKREEREGTERGGRGEGKEGRVKRKGGGEEKGGDEENGEGVKRKGGDEGERFNNRTQQMPCHHKSLSSDFHLHHLA